MPTERALIVHQDEGLRQAIFRAIFRGEVRQTHLTIIITLLTLFIMKSKQAKESLKEKARRTISDAIMNGKLKPGDQIDRRSVAKKLNMSVAPVLEAMLLLTEVRND